ncbi:hypothetical protein SNE510_35820 [Streptomyces sp. NE5-10]|nr:hypothetical protein SNE510_35820 [Streptomyces sp. NE5-10]
MPSENASAAGAPKAYQAARAGRRLASCTGSRESPPTAETVVAYQSPATKAATKPLPSTRTEAA